MRWIGCGQWASFALHAAAPLEADFYTPVFPSKVPFDHGLVQTHPIPVPTCASSVASHPGEVPFDQGLVRQAAALTKRLPAVDSPQFASDYTTVRCGRDFSKQPILRCAVSQWHSAGHALWPFFWHHPGCLTWQACLVSLPAGAQRYAADHPAGCSHKGHRCLQRNRGQGKEGIMGMPCSSLGGVPKVLHGCAAPQPSDMA